jgi:hypothetical protein
MSTIEISLPTQVDGMKMKKEEAGETFPPLWRNLCDILFKTVPPNKQ